MNIFLVSFLYLFSVVSAQKDFYKAKYTEKALVDPPHHKGKHEAKTKICPPDFFFDKGVCLKKDEVPFAKVCLAGSLDVGDVCLEFSPPKFECPEGTQRVGEECLKKEETRHDLFCPAVAPLRDHKCTATFTEPASCHFGEAVEIERGRELCVIRKPVEKRCPKEFDPHGLLCILRREEKPLLECPNPPHFLLKHEKCFFEAEVEKVCPRGYADIGENECVKFEPRIEFCPEGFTKVATECVKKHFKPKVETCANGGNPKEECKKEVLVPETPTCYPPWKLIHGVCQRNVFQPASFRCPEGYYPKHEKCEKEVEYDCSTTTHEVECKPAPRPGKEELYDGPRALGEAEEPKEYAKDKYVREKPLPVCHKVPIVHPKKCTRFITAEGIPFCKEGVYKGGNRCEIEEIESPKLKCDAKLDKEGRCFTEETSKPIRFCPEGYSLGETQICTREEVRGLELKCPEGTVGPECAKLAKKICPGGSCFRTLETPATVSCPVGFTKEEKYVKEEKIKCVKSLFADYESFCRHGKKEGLTCVTSRPLETKTGKSSFPPIPICPRYFADDGAQCVKKTLFPAEPKCRKEFHFQNGRCVHESHKKTVCPKGSVHEKGKCWSFEKAEPITVETVVKDRHSKKAEDDSY